MQTRNSPYSLKKLQGWAKIVHLPGFDQMSTTALYKALKNSYNIDRLQRREDLEEKRSKNESKKRKKDSVDDINENSKKKSLSTSSSTTSNEMKKVQSLNKIDPIMLEEIKKDHYKFVRPNGSIILFNLDSLIDFMLKSGDFTDPVTRTTFSDDDLKEIDALAIKSKLNKGSVYKAKHEPNRYADAIFIRDALLGLERCAGEVITEILNITETCESEEAHIRLLTNELPLFQHYYRQIANADQSYASQCMMHWKAFLSGPPNRPNEDLYGLIEIVIHFLSMCEKSIIENNIDDSDNDNEFSF